MAFQIKDFRSITASMLNWLKANTTRVSDFNPGSVVRTMVEAPAAELEELYLQFFIGLREAIPVSVFQTFGFDSLPAKSASGLVRFTTATAATATISIPAGTLVKAPGSGQTYATSGDAFILVGQTYVDTLVSAQVPGIIGNVDMAAIVELVSSVPGISAVSNPAPLLNGTDAETDDERTLRFRGYISTLARGTKAAVEYGARTAKVVNSSGVVTEYVAHASVYEPWVDDPLQPIALVRCFVHNGSSATSAALVSIAQQVIDGYTDASGAPVVGSGWKAAGVKCVVTAASDLPVNVTGTIDVAPGYTSADVIAQAIEAVTTYIQIQGVGADILVAELVAIVKRDVPGVYNVTLTAPAADVATAYNAKAIPGTITLTEAP